MTKYKGKGSKRALSVCLALPPILSLANAHARRCIALLWLPRRSLKAALADRSPDPYGKGPEPNVHRALVAYQALLGRR